MKKAKTIFDHIAGITYKKVEWDDLTEADQKSFSPYLINRWLSMNYELIEYVDMFQRYTIGPLSTKNVYQLYHGLLPERKFFSKYIKGKKADKYNKDLIAKVAEHFQVSKSESEEYVAILIEHHEDELRDMLRKYGKTDKEINQWLK